MILFWFKEAFKLIARSKFSFLLALISITLSVILFAVSAVIILLSDHFESELKSNIVISIFIKENLEPSSLDQIKTDLMNNDFTKSTEYIDKEQAAELFIKETGEDFRKILDYNPLPASFNLKLNDQYAHKDSIKNVIAHLSKQNWVDEVVFRQDFYQKVLAYIDKAKVYIFIITGLIFFVSLYLVYSTVRLILNSKYSELETMKFVGAKLSTIKMPIILNSAITGLIGSLIALGAMWSSYYYLKEYFISLKQVLPESYILIAAVLAIGPLIGILVTVLSLRKISLKI